MSSSRRTDFDPLDEVSEMSDSDIVFSRVRLGDITATVAMEFDTSGLTAKYGLSVKSPKDVYNKTKGFTIARERLLTCRQRDFTSGTFDFDRDLRRHASQAARQIVKYWADCQVSRDRPFSTKTAAAVSSLLCWVDHSDGRYVVSLKDKIPEERPRPEIP